MKKNIKCLFAFALTFTVGMSPGVVRAEERGAELMQLCQDFCGWCEAGAIQSWHCELQRCNPQSPCGFESTKLITCLEEEKACASEKCMAAQEDYETCKNTFPACGDGLVSGDEECDWGLASNVALPRHGGASCGDDCKLHPDCEFEEEGCPPDEDGHAEH